MKGLALRAHRRSGLRLSNAGRRNFRPSAEQLEDRSLLSAFATIQGEISTPAEKDVFPIRIDAADIALHRWGTYVGFEMHRVGGSQLDPSPVLVRGLVRPV